MATTFARGTAFILGAKTLHLYDFKYTVFRQWNKVLYEDFQLYVDATLNFRL